MATAKAKKKTVGAATKVAVNKPAKRRAVSATRRKRKSALR